MESTSLSEPPRPAQGGSVAGARDAAVAPGFELARAGDRFAPLDGLRGIAVLLVVVVHYFVTPPGPAESSSYALLQRAFSLSFCGVDLFFVLSGFLIGGILIDHRESRQLLPAFYARRFFRIVPLYVVLLASYFICREIPGLTAVNRGTYFWSTLPDWSFLTFTQNIAMAWKRDIGPYWLGATWSLAVEEQFYLLMPLLIVRLKVAQTVRICLCLIALAAAFRINALYNAQNSIAAIFLLPARMDGLLWGVVCAALVRDARLLEIVRRYGEELSALLIGLAVTLLALSLGKFAADSVEIALFGYSALSVFFMGVVLHVVALPESRFARLMSFRPLRTVGLTSYFIYLFHAPIWYLLHWLLLKRPPLHVTWAAGGITCLALVATLGAGLASWRWFEAPLLRIGRRFSYEKTPPASAGAPS